MFHFPTKHHKWERPGWEHGCWEDASQMWKDRTKEGGGLLSLCLSANTLKVPGINRHWESQMFSAWAGSDVKDLDPNLEFRAKTAICRTKNRYKEGLQAPSHQQHFFYLPLWPARILTGLTHLSSDTAPVLQTGLPFSDLHMHVYLLAGATCTCNIPAHTWTHTQIHTPIIIQRKVI